MSEHDPVTLTEALDRVLRSLAPGVSAKAVGGVFQRWPEVVGDQIALHATPVSLRDGRLVVEVDQAGWATQLRFLERDLLVRLADIAGVGAVQSIDIRVKR